ncbi:hypothetical protein AWZ03_000039 [Drosophila navojoa]|uniref:DUF4794 domain-containing protein n=1 Tax=Drosophila navojoa TaxID=7232 RepID=A0A484BX21_DRONA|nr:exocyst complex component 5 isoform X2 [Drosophila navojoa]XP_017957597.1 exocyst complex component 5 isoform X1 [Drosophila navojoa]TDG53224.1 hypothetical protein AWZ03_000039 [Drosophila navojoa]
MPSICLLLVICLVACSQAIRVDWGTNTGPIVPPPPRTTPAPPSRPYREPAPVWEDQSDDIPNPHPYVYVLPPPSRPRTWVIPAGPYAPPNYNNQPPKYNNYGQLVDPYSNGNAGARPATGTVSVPALAAQYVPGVGIKYTAIAPNNNKLQGKYNAKTKKYKAYEKAKYAPWNYLQLLPVEEKALDWQEAEEAPVKEPHSEMPQDTLSSSTTAAPNSSSSSSPATVTTTTTTTTAATPTTAATQASTQQTTTTTTAAMFANYKLAHEKSAYLKKHNKLKKLLEKLQAPSSPTQANATSS